MNNNFFHFLKNIFISHEKNNHRPHILRGVTLIIISFVAIFLLGVSYGRYFFLHKTVLGQSVESSVLIDLTNETRLKYGATPLLKNYKLEQASLLKANDMVENQYFSHNSPSGVSPWYWIKKAGYNFIYAGENLAIDFVQSKDVEDAWLESPSHRANILNDKFTDVGISTKLGKFNGQNTIFVVQMFGTPDININENNISSSSSDIKVLSRSNATGTQSTTAIENSFVVIEKATILDEGKVLGESAENPKYSTFVDRFIFDLWFRLNMFYKIFIILISVSLISLFFVEFKKHHWKHIAYGLLAIIFMLFLLYLNYSIW